MTPINKKAARARLEEQKRGEHKNVFANRNISLKLINTEKEANSFLPLSCAINKAQKIYSAENYTNKSNKVEKDFDVLYLNKNLTYLGKFKLYNFILITKLILLSYLFFLYSLNLSLLIVFTYFATILGYVFLRYLLNNTKFVIKIPPMHNRW